MTNQNQQTRPCPEWLDRILAAGFKPYIATSRRLLPALNTSPFGQVAECFIIEDPDHGPFHEAYLLSNSLSFKSPDLKMPHWVLIDCALLQTAVVGFMKATADLPEDLLSHYRKDPSIDLDRLEYLPVSGQIASPAFGNSVVGISLFSLGSSLGIKQNLGLYTKALAMEVYAAANFDHYYGIAQYNNPSIKIHGRFSSCMEIYQPIVPLHPGKDMTLIYKMAIDFDPYKLDDPLPEPVEPTFWLNARDISGKTRMQAGIAEGKRYIIAPPYSVKRDGEIFLPIREEK